MNEGTIERIDISELEDAATLLELAEEGTIVVTRDGKDAYAVIRYDEFRELNEALEIRDAKSVESSVVSVSIEGEIETGSIANTIPAALDEGETEPNGGSFQPSQVDGPTHTDQTKRSMPYISAQLPNTPIPSDDYSRSMWQGAITERMRKVMEAEAPIEKQRLFNMVRASFGIKRSGRDIQSHNDWLFKRGIEHIETEFNGALFIWLPDQDPDSYDTYRPTNDIANRQISEYPYQELKAAMQDALDGSLGLSRDELIEDTMRLLGYKRKTNRVKEVIGAAIQQSVNNGSLALMPDGTFIIAE